MNTINFTARFLQKSQVNKMELDESYSPCDISIVELDKNNSEDINAIYRTAQNWHQQGGGILAFNILNDALKGYEYNDINNEHYLAATTQNGDYAKLDPKKILGLTLFSESNSYENEINFIEVKPIASKSLSSYREYKGIGSALVKYLKENYTKKPIYVVSAHDAIDFYKKQDFKPVDDYSGCSFLIYKA